MKIAVGSDHAGFPLKQAMAEFVRELGHEVIDVGAFDCSPSDYPDFAEMVAREVLSGDAERGILVCGSGIGASVAANKIPGIIAGNVTDTYSARQGVQHDAMNVLVLGGRVVGDALAQEIVRAFVSASFSGEDRHRRRLDKVFAIERRYATHDPKPESV